MLSSVKPGHGEITTISNNLECYTSFTVNDVTFIDSRQFVLSTLDKLSSNFGKDQTEADQNIFRVILCLTTKSTTN